MHTVHTEIDIEAAPNVVWEVLTDLSAYPDWNPYVVRATGNIVPGERIRVRLDPPGGLAMTFRPNVTVVEQDRIFEWLGRLGVRGLFDGRHRFRLEPNERGTRFIHEEEFGGQPVPLLARSLDTSTRAGFAAMNEAIKERAEAGVRR